MNKKLLLQAIETLRNVEFGEIEGVSVESSNYDDGSEYLTINVDFKKEKEQILRNY